MPTYTAPTRDLQFVLQDVLDVAGSDIPGYGDLDREMTQAVLEEAGKLAVEVLAPLNPVGDAEGCVGIKVTTTARCVGQTGVEMEALTAASAALLTIYDMCKAIDRGMRIEAIQLEEKHGGKSGVWRRDSTANEEGK